MAARSITESHLEKTTSHSGEEAAKTKRNGREEAGNGTETSQNSPTLVPLHRTTPQLTPSQSTTPQSRPFHQTPIFKQTTQEDLTGFEIHWSISAGVRLDKIGVDVGIEEIGNSCVGG
ncbi:MAG: hypothetical protein LQ350_004924 [Teloschistes chrysophthalmus]|nr:MAG: hypothetical protein LQ350_004924 [Niorma chrysophthalma]